MRGSVRGTLSNQCSYRVCNKNKSIMHLNFTSKITSYNEAIDGEIIQVIFEEYENEDAFNQTALYLLLSSA